MVNVVSFLPMRHIPQLTTKKNSVKTLLLFCAVVFIIILISLVAKVVAVIREGKFHGDHTFTISVKQPDSLDLFIFHPVEKSVIQLQLPDISSVSEAKESTGSFIEGEISTKREIDESYSISMVLQNALLNQNGVDSTLSLFDLLRMRWIARAIPDGEVEKEIITKSMTVEEIDEVVRTVLLDKKFSEENLTIEIVNGSGVPGIGSKLGRALQNSGANVISVANADKEVNETTVMYYGKESETTKRLGRLLYASPIEISEQGLSDIIITLGRSRADQNPF